MKENYDWSAVMECYEPGEPIDYGKNEQDAIDNLLCQEDDRLQGWYEGGIMVVR